MTDELVYVSIDDYGSLTALLDERRKMVRRHEIARKKPSRRQGTLSEKLAVDRAQKAELAEVNRLIEELTEATKGHQP